MRSFDPMADRRGRYQVPPIACLMAFGPSALLSLRSPAGSPHVHVCLKEVTLDLAVFANAITVAPPSVPRRSRRQPADPGQLTFADLLWTLPEAILSTPGSALADLPLVIDGYFRLTDDILSKAGGLKARFKENIDAIELLKILELEGRKATEEEMDILAKYNGWGCLPQLFETWTHPDWRDEQIKLLELLTDEEYEAAQGSTPNAFYTSLEIIRFIYRALEQMGFKGGRILEPSMGIGHFFGLMPDRMLAHSKLSGIELDLLTGRIAQQLYPAADIRIEGYQISKLPEGFYDVAIGNVPFGNYKLYDPKFKKHRFPIHDYFFAKSLAVLRPGGIIAFVTSRFTMDKVESNLRDYVYERADLLGAVRLPAGAFKAFAHTDVVTDIIFLQKRKEGTLPKGPAWKLLKPLELKDAEEPHEVNEYFLDNPQMVLGTFSLESNKYSNEALTVRPNGKDLERALSEVLSFLPSGVFTAPVPEKKEILHVYAAAPDDLKDGAFIIQDGKLYRNSGGNLVPSESPSSVVARIDGMIGIRDAVRELLHDELRTSDNTAVSVRREHLNTLYDDFVVRFGHLNARENRRAFSEDPDYPLLLSLELWDEDKKTAQKAPIFTDRVIYPVVRPEKAETAQEALLITLNECGTLDFGRMSELTGKTAEQMQKELEELIYQTPEGKWVTADEYLSGNVREKLLEAEAASRLDAAFEKNVKALQEAQPRDLEWSEIQANLGASWIPGDDIKRFIFDLLDIKRADAVSVGFADAIGSWVVRVHPHSRQQIEQNVLNTKTWGTSRKPAIDLITEALNQQIPKVEDYDRSLDKHVLNVPETEAAREKQARIKEHFRKWIWEDPDRRERLCRDYNQKFNNIRLRSFDGSHLTFPGMSSQLALRLHQKNGVWRIITTGNTLLDHTVGTGKTFIMTAAAMEMKRLGLVSKPMFIVPNHLLEQFGAEFLRLYPLANVLLARKEDFTPLRRKMLFSKIALGNWDAVVVTHSSFEKMGLSAETAADHLQKMLDDILEALLQEKDKSDDRIVVKELEKQKKRYEAKLEERLDQEAKDDCLTFEELGVDMLFVDEADMFKNLFYVTKMTRVAGLPQSESNRSFDLFCKAQWLTDRGKPVVFATGTPISNSMAEMYTMKRYLAMPLLREMGLHHFDSWAATFGETVTTLELSPDGAGYRMRTRFARFCNLPEMQQMYRTFADVITAEMVDIPKPTMEGGKPIVISSPGTDQLKAFVKTLVERADRIRSGGVHPKEDNMLRVTTDGRKAALDMRLIDPTAEDHPDSKVNMAVRTVFREWMESAERKGAHLIFCDYSTPSSKGFNVYSDMKHKLISLGVPEEEVTFIHDADTDVKKKALFYRVRTGKVRLLFGSTEKMGAGTNVQDLLESSHHIDCPWRPRDVEQRDGRILRQGNRNKTVRIYRYVTTGSFDAYMWQTVETKARFIAQIKCGDLSVRSAEDIEGIVLNYAEIKAIASGNPLVRTKFEVDLEVRRLEQLEQQHYNERFRMQYRLQYSQSEIKTTEKLIAGFEKDIRTRSIPEKFLMIINNTEYCDRQSAGSELHRLERAYSGKGSTYRIGSYCGFPLFLEATEHKFGGGSLFAEGEVKHFGKFTDTIGGVILSLDHTLRTMEQRLAAQRRYIEEQQQTVADLSAELAKPSPYAEQLEAAQARQKEINALLDLDKQKQETVAVGDLPEDLPEAA